MSVTKFHGAVAACVVAMSVAGIAAGPAAAKDRGTLHGTVQEYFWYWNDSRTFIPRTFIQADFVAPAALPKIVFTVVPATPSRLVYLEFRQDGQWVSENVVKTDAQGVALIDVDPFCSNLTWCDGTYRYRLRIGAVLAPVTISYSEGGRNIARVGDTPAHSRPADGSGTRD